jgi:hypothetical protein
MHLQLQVQGIKETVFYVLHSDYLKVDKDGPPPPIPLFHNTETLNLYIQKAGKPSVSLPS